MSKAASKRCKRKGCPKPCNKRENETLAAFARREYCSRDCNIIVQKRRQHRLRKMGICG